MGGHGGLNILPQKRWNVYNYENREKVRKDEEAAAKEEQLKREQSRKRDAELRLEKLRQARGLASSSQSDTVSVESPNLGQKSESNHINLFEGIRIFDPVGVGGTDGKDDDKSRFKKMKMMKKETAPKVLMPEDEKYRLGYGVAGKGVKLPWYLSRPSDDADTKSDRNSDDDIDARARVGKEGSKSGAKKSLDQLREERLNREKKEKERERALLLGKKRRDDPVPRDRYFTRR